MLINKELDAIESYDALCALKNGIKINGVNLEYEDFGDKTDIHPENACEYGCGDMQFIPFNEIKKSTLKKYNITEKEYREIQKKLDCLSFGCCGWCV